MGQIDQHAQPIHLTDDVAAERREAVVHRRLGLDVAELVDPIVHELNRSHPAVVRPLHVLETRFKKIAALDGHDRHTLARRRRRGEIAAAQHATHAERPGVAVEHIELSPRGRQHDARRRLARGVGRAVRTNR